MSTTTETSTSTSIQRKGDKITVKTTITTTVKELGKEPKVTVKENTDVYEGKEGWERLPKDIKEQLEDSDKPKPDQGPINKKAAKKDFEKKLLDAINKIRDQHGASSLKLDSDASKYALKRATEMAAADDLVPRSSNDYGENITSLWSSDPNHKAQVDNICERWYTEGKTYKFDEEPSTMEAGHFTQLVWKGSKKFGAAAVKSDKNKIYVVSAYYPAGNWKNEFKENVGPVKESTINSILNALSLKGKDSSSSSSEEEGDSIDSFNKEGLKAHNAYRKKHGVAPLKYSDTLAKYAQEWANQLASSGKFEHRTGHKYGENLYTYYSSSGAKPTAEDAVKTWYDEIKAYTFGKEPTKMGTGHFTQVVWKGSTQVGMGVAKNHKGWIVVANYSPPGNMIGSYVANVPAPK